MTPQEIISALEGATEPNRKLDIELAYLCGYSLKSNTAGNIWLDRKGNESKNPPFFTRNTDHALILHQLLTPTARVALSWDEEGGYAKVGDGESVAAKTLPIAICVATLLAWTS